MSTELLTGGEDSVTVPRSRVAKAWLKRHRVLLAVAGLLVLLALAADQWQQQRELDQMLEAIQSGEQDMRATDDYFSGVIAYYSPLIFREAAPAGLREGFQVDIDHGVDGGLTAIAATSQALDDITVLPWHRHLRTARAAYQQRILAWQDYLGTITDGAGALFDASTTVTVDVETTRSALLLALPWTADATDRARIEDAVPGPG